MRSQTPILRGSNPLARLPDFSFTPAWCPAEAVLLTELGRAWQALPCDAALDTEEAGSHGGAQWTRLDAQIDRLS